MLVTTHPLMHSIPAVRDSNVQHELRWPLPRNPFAQEQELKYMQNTSAILRN